MKRLAKDTVTSNTGIQDAKCVFTIEDIKILLSEIRELDDFDINIKQGRVDDNYTVRIGQSSYQLSGKSKNVYGKK